MLVLSSSPILIARNFKKYLGHIELMEHEYLIGTRGTSDRWRAAYTKLKGMASCGHYWRIFTIYMPAKHQWSSCPIYAYILDSQLRKQRKNPIKMVLGLKGLHSCSSPSNNSHWAMGIIDGIIFRNLIWHYSNSLVTIIF